MNIFKFPVMLEIDKLFDANKITNPNGTANKKDLLIPPLLVSEFAV